MDLIHLESLMDTMEVTLRGQRYSITQLSVNDYIKQSVRRKLDMSQGTETYLENAVEILSEHSNISKEMLGELNRKEIAALLLATQGINPMAIEQSAGKQAGDCGKK